MRDIRHPYKHACKINHIYNHKYIACVRFMHPTHIYRHTRNSMRDIRHPYKQHDLYYINTLNKAHIYTHLLCDTKDEFRLGYHVGYQFLRAQKPPPRLERKAWIVLRTRRYLRSWQGIRASTLRCSQSMHALRSWRG